MMNFKVIPAILVLCWLRYSEATWPGWRSRDECPQLSCPSIYIPPECRQSEFTYVNGRRCPACDIDTCQGGNDRGNNRDRWDNNRGGRGGNWDNNRGGSGKNWDNNRGGRGRNGDNNRGGMGGNWDSSRDRNLDRGGQWDSNRGGRNVDTSRGGSVSFDRTRGDVTWETDRNRNRWDSSRGGSWDNNRSSSRVDDRRGGSNWDNNRGNQGGSGSAGNRGPGGNRSDRGNESGRGGGRFDGASGPSRNDRPRF